MTTDANKSMVQSFIDLPMYDEVSEAKCGPAGKYTLVISDVKLKENDDGSAKGFLVICEIQKAPQGVKSEELANIMHNISFPQKGDDPEKVKNKMLFIKRFTTLFKIPVKNNALDPMQFPGKKAECDLTVEDYEGTKSNKIKLPPIK